MDKFKNKLLCCYCDKMFQNYDELEKHLRDVHYINSKTKWFPCRTNNCSEGFTRLTYFKNHVQKIHDLTLLSESDIRYTNEDAEKVWIPSMMNFNDLVAKSISNLRFNNSITGTALGSFVTEVENILREIMSNIREKIEEYFKYKKYDSPDTKMFIDQFIFNETLSKYKSMEGQIAALKKNYKYINPESKFIGLNKKDEFLYIPLISTLKLILSNEEVMRYVENNSNESPDELMRSYEDGDTFKEHAFFKKYPNSLRIQLYFDEFVGNNPLSNKASNQKIAAFYFSILNLPPHLNYFVGNVHVLALCHNKLVQEFSTNQILEPFVNELKLLERDEGYPVEINNKEYILRATLATVTADTAAANPLLGFLGPGATHFCRVCMISRCQLHNSSYFPAEYRTKKLLEEQLQEILLDPTVSTKYGIKGPCILNELKYFNSCFNLVFDVLHDLFQGWVPFIIKLVLAHFVIKKNYFDVGLINYRLKIFLYGGPEEGNKPSPTFDLQGLKNVKTEHSLKQKAVQSWCLLRVIPFIIYDKVDPDDIYLKFLVDLNKIVEILMAPALSRSILPYLRHLLKTHYTQFNILFPDVKKINKIDHVMHSADCIEKFGPISNYSCFKYEDRHQLFSRYTQITRNFKFIPKSLVNLSQIYQSSLWGSNKNPIRERITYTSTTTEIIQNLDAPHELFTQIGFKLEDEVKYTEKIKVYGIKYKIDFFVAIGLHAETGLPVFGEVKNIFIAKDEVFLLYINWKSTYLNENLNAYNVESTNEFCLINVRDLSDRKPYALWHTFTEDTLHYISLRHILY